MMARKALKEEKNEFVIMITKLRWFLFFFAYFFSCSYGNDENIHIRTQRETSNMRTHLRTAAAVSLFHIFFLSTSLSLSLSCSISLKSVMIILGWRYLTYALDDDDAADAYERTIHSHFPWQDHCCWNKEECRAIIWKKGQVLLV